MERGATGTWTHRTDAAGVAYKSFAPFPLPPVPPPATDGPWRALADEALIAVSRLDSVSMLLPDASHLLYAYVRKEAVLSSQIEGTQSSLSDLLLFENDAAPGVPVEDVREVSCYVAAAEHGVKLLREGMPLSRRLLCDVHRTLMSSGRGSGKAPGEFRRSPVWLGGPRPDHAMFVPPHASELSDHFGSLERFLNDADVRTPALVKAALAHAQFETIHPFLDGNGRLGRLLVTFVLCAEGVLAEPLLYLSLYLKRRRTEYYAALQRIRTHGDWESWLEFFCLGVRDVGRAAFDAAKALARLFDDDRRRLRELGRGAGSALRVHEAFCRKPVMTAAAVVRATGLSLPAVNHATEALRRWNVVRELSGKRRNRVFAYGAYLDVLEEA